MNDPDNVAVIETRGLRKEYRLGSETIHALRGVDLGIQRGEYVAVMGPSGSGKSTLMNLIGCLDTPTGGDYVLNGQAVAGLNDDALARIRNREIGFVFQTFNLLPRLSALENVALPLVYTGIGRRDRLERARAALVSVELGKRVDHKPNELSGGERRSTRAVHGRQLAVNLLEAVGSALRMIRAHKLRAFFTVLGTVVGVTFLIAVITLVEGMDRYVTEDFASAVYGHNTVQLRRTPSIQMNTDSEQWRAWQRRPYMAFDDAEWLAERMETPSVVGHSTFRQAALLANGRAVENVMLTAASGSYFRIRDGGG